MEKKWVGAIVMLVLVSGWFCSRCCGCLEEERIALLNFKHSILPPTSNVLASWGAHGDCCKWVEIECNITTKRVIQLSLNYTRGWPSEGWYLNCSLFSPLKELKSLFLRGNNIFGFMKNEALERLSSLSNLEVLDLSYNQLNNSILSSLASLSSLKVLNLAGNQMEGSLHIPELIGLNKLKELDLSYNNVESFMVPKGIKRPLGRSNLEVLHLNDNSFNNTILSSLRGLPSLKILDLSRNELKGVLNIEELVGLSKLMELDLSSNTVESFVAPKGIKRLLDLSNLEVLHLYNNSFNNTNLSSLRGLSSLTSLDLGGNKLQGIINIEELVALNNLKELDLSYNEVESFVALKDSHTFKELEVLILDGSSLHNNFPQSIRTLTSLKVLSLSSCELSGTLPNQEWCELKNLEELDLSTNNFRGMLPSCLGNLSYLWALDVSSNNFTGNIATSPLTNLKSIEYLSFSSNNFQVPVSFRMFANHSKLKVLLGDDNNLMLEPLLQTPTPKFQLMVLSLSYLALKKPPNFLHHQNDLRVVHLSHNNITGGFPFWLFMNNTALEVLNLGFNFISGPLQLPLQTHFNITILDVTGNSLRGKFPINMSSIFPHLTDLIMSKNSFRGQIPTSFGDMKSLRFLSLTNNQFFGSIPDSFDRLSSLIFLDLSNNRLSGGIPQFPILSNNSLQGQVFPLLFKLRSLLVLRLGGNNFAGEIPEISSVNSFYPLIIDMSNNHISGKLPRWMGNMSSLHGLFLSKNHFEGPIPIEFCNLNSLRYLDLSDNYLSGSIPKCFNSIPIRYVHLSNNRFTGPLTKAFLGSSSLETLDLTRNSLTGIIPSWIGSLPSLSILLLKANHFEGEIPIQLCQLNNLRIVDLSQNNLFGFIPLCLSNLTFKGSVEANPVGGYSPVAETAVLQLLLDMWKKESGKNFYFIVMSKNEMINVEEWAEFTTKSMTYVYNGSIFSRMTGIDLSCNHLTGKIPLEIGYLNEIHALNLSHNKLTGPIPSTFSNLKQIESLDVSYNNLNGRIPPQLTELNTLAVFSVAYNNLSGPTPDQKAQFGTFDESSYEGNPFLCGAPLQINCTEIESSSILTNVSDYDWENNGFIDMNVFYWSFVVAYVAALMAIAVVLCINPYWRWAWFYSIEVYITSCYYFVLDYFCWFSK